MTSPSTVLSPEPDLSKMTTEQLNAYRRSLLVEILNAPYREPSRRYARVSRELARRAAR